MTEETRYQEPVNIFEQKKLIENLISSPGFVMLAKVIQAQVDGLQNEVLFSPLKSMDEAFVMERKKGQIEGRLSLMATAEAMLEELQMDYQQAHAKKEQENVETSLRFDE